VAACPARSSRPAGSSTGDPELALAIAAQADGQGTCITPIDDLGRGLDRQWISISNTAYTGDTEDFLRAGRAIGAAIAATNHKVVLVASGTVAHLLAAARVARA